MEKKAAEKPLQGEPRNRIQKKKVILWGTVGFLVSLWMFMLGLLVGRGTAPVRFDIHKLQKELAGLKQATVEKTTHRYKVAFEALDKEIDLGFHEALRDPKLNIQAPAPAETNHPEETPASVETGTTLPRKIKNERFKKKKATVGNIVIQVAASQDEHHAERLVTELNALGYHAYRTVGALPEKGTWHRIRISSFETKDEALAAVNQLKDKGFSPIFVEQE